MAKINFQGKKSFLSKIGKKNITVICAVLIIGIAVYLNYMFFYDGGTKPEKDSSELQESGEVTQTSASTDSYFTATQLSRQQARDEALEVLRTVIENQNALETTKAEALEDMTRIAAEIETESRIETLITAKGFSQCIAVINGDKASIVVKNDGELLANQLTQINEIVYNEAGISPTNVKIIQK